MKIEEVKGLFALAGIPVLNIKPLPTAGMRWNHAFGIGVRSADSDLAGYHTGARVKLRSSVTF